MSFVCFVRVLNVATNLIKSDFFVKTFSVKMSLFRYQVFACLACLLHCLTLQVVAQKDAVPEAQGGISKLFDARLWTHYNGIVFGGFITVVSLLSLLLYFEIYYIRKWTSSR